MKNLIILSIFLFFSTKSFSQSTLTFNSSNTNIEDTHCAHLSPYKEQNYGQTEGIWAYAGTIGGQPNYNRVYIDFNETLPQNIVVDKVVLKLFFNPANANETSHLGNNALWVKRVTSEWSENAINGNTEPSFSNNNKVSVLGTGTSTDDYTIDITPVYLDAIANPNNSHGFMLQLQDESSSFKIAMFGSSENPDPSKRPVLEITYHQANILTFTTENTDIEDTHCAHLSPYKEQNYGQMEGIWAYAGTIGGQPNYNRVYIDFNETLPQNIVVDKAVLKLFFNPANANETSHLGNNALWVKRVTSEWDENAINGNTEPSFSDNNKVSVLGTGTSTDNYAIDITPIYLDAIANPNNSHGFMLQLQDESSSFKIAMFGSSENPDPSKRPILEIAYHTIVNSKEPNQQLSDVILFPNPTSGDISIRTNNNTQVLKVQIYNILGQGVQEYNNPTYIHLGTPGLYLAKITTNHGEKTKKIVVKKP